MGTLSSRQLYWSGVAVFAALAAITFAWWASRGALPPSYVIVMVPLSAIAVMLLFASQIKPLRAGIAQTNALAAIVIRHEQRIGTLEQQYADLLYQVINLKEAIAQAHAKGYADGVRRRLNGPPLPHQFRP